jgi:spore coat protein A, manganese oxidase
MALALRHTGNQSSSQPTHAAMPAAKNQLNANSLPQFVDRLTIPEVIQPSGHRPNPDDARVQLPYYKVAMHDFERKVHRDLPPARMWGFASSSPGPIFETRSGKGVLVEWANDLPDKHLFTIDHNIHGAEATKPEVRTVVHLHGAKAGPTSDGYPENWYTRGKSALYHYPNNQDAAMLWYHDHALGINRLNVYAGLLGLYFIRDEFEDALNLPRGKYELPLVLCDRIFDLDGKLIYPVSADPNAPWVPEVLGDAILVNGTLFPYVDVEPRRYRLRILNGANGRSFHLTFSAPDARWFPKFHQIGTDQGLLPAPVESSRVRLMPGERADLIFDFSTYAGTSVVLRNDNFNMMQFRVAAKGERDTNSLPQALRPLPKIPDSSAAKTRFLTLVESDDANHRPIRSLLNNAHWTDPVSENPVLDSVEIWNFINLTNDDHPIHLHLVRFQILDRRPFSVNTYLSTAELKFLGPPVPSDPAESGWKDTVRGDHGMVTRIIIRFEGFTGRYVWHCHILEHEDNEMMRPFDVVARESAKP